MKNRKTSSENLFIENEKLGRNITMKSFSIIMFCLCISLFANAQKDTLATYVNMTFEEILNVKVTTASKFTEPIFLAPANMSIISAEEIESYGANNLNEILDRVTSIYSCGSYFAPQGILSMRGTITTQFNTHILILLNGRPLRESAQTGYNVAIYEAFPVSTIKQIEIIRGSGSVLYGSNAYSGVINIITKKISDKTQIEAKFISGAFETYNSNLLLSKKIGAFKIKSSLLLNVTSGWDYTARGETDIKLVNGIDSFINQPKTIKMNKNTKSLLLEAEYKAFRANIFGIITNFNYMNGIPAWSNPIRNEMELNQFYSSFGYEKLLLKKIEIKTNIDCNYSNRKQLSNSKYNPSYVTQNSYSILSEFTVSYKLSNTLNVLGGGTFLNSFINTISYRQNANGTSFKDFDTKTNPAPYSLNDNRSENTYCTYMQASYHPVKFIYFDIGAQFYKTDKLNWHFVPKLNTVINWNDYLFFKIIYGKAYRSPSLVERYDNYNPIINSNYPPASVGGGLDIKPENIRTTDIQLIYKNNKYIFIASVFDNLETDLITRSLPTDSLVIATEGEIGKKLATPKYINKGTLNSKGIELEVKATLLKNFNLSTSCSLFKVGDGTIQQNTGMPNTMFKVGISYKLKAFSLGIFNSYFDKGEDINAKYPNANPEVKAYNSLSANISINVKKMLDIKNWKKGDVILDIYGTNLLNEEIFYPEYVRRTINSIPGRAGRALYFGLKINI